MSLSLRQKSSLICYFVIYILSFYVLFIPKVLGDWTNDKEAPTTTITVDCKDSSETIKNTLILTASSSTGTCSNLADRATVSISCADTPAPPDGSECKTTTYTADLADLNPNNQTITWNPPNGSTNYTVYNSAGTHNVSSIKSVDNAGNEETAFIATIYFKYNITGTVFIDYNMNGAKDSPPDTGYLGGTTVTLSGGATASTTTDATGNYTFSDLPSGLNYTVSLTDPPGYTSNRSIYPLALANPYPFPTTLRANASHDFSITPLYTISGTVFVDNNHDGVWQQGTELAYTALASPTMEVDDTSTGHTVSYPGSGTYQVSSLTSRQYWVTIYIPAGYLLTTRNTSVVFPDAGTCYDPSTNPWTSLGSPGYSSCNGGKAYQTTFTLTTNTTIDFGITPLYSISGNLYTDVDGNGAYTAGTDTAFSTGATNAIHLKDSATNTEITASSPVNSNASGYYAFITVSGTYNVSVDTPTGYKQVLYIGTITQPFTVNANITGVNFLVQGFKISGNLFDDTNKNGLKGAGESNKTGTTIGIYTNSNCSTALVTSLSVTSAGYTSGQTLVQGTYYVCDKTDLQSIGYTTTFPQNGSPAFYTVNVGTPCNFSPSTLGDGITPVDASCSGGNISNLNFGITNSNAWFQCIGADCRGHDVFIDPIPPTTVCGGAYASIASENNLSPGIIYSNSTPNFGQGNASPQNWQVVDSYHGVNPNTLRTSYSYLLTNARQSGITVNDFSTATYGCTNFESCILNPNLANGIYKADTYTINPGSHRLVLANPPATYTFPANRSIIFLIDGDLYLNGEIHVPTTSNITFAATGSIHVSKDVGTSTISSTTTQIEGFYSTDGSFIVEGYNDCVAHGSDTRLNIGGTVVTDADRNGVGSFQRNRDLCDGNLSCPAVSVIARPDLLLNAPELIKTPNYVWQEVAP